MSKTSNEQFPAANLIHSKTTSRREFMKLAVQSGLTVAGATSLWSGFAHAQPKAGGTARVGMADGATTDSWDPAVTNTRYMIHMNHVNRNMLTEITSDNKLGPELSKSWEASADATNWTFELEDGVEFHNGKTFGADDVVATLNYHRDPATGSAVASLLEPIEDIKADGKNTVSIKLKSGNADFPYLMTDYHLCILPSDDNGGVLINEIGTGCYKVERHESGVSTKLVRNPNNWKSDAAYFDEVIFTTINDANARQTSLVSSDIDFIDEVDLKTVSLLQREADIEVDQAESASYASLPMRMDVAPFDNYDVRMALKYAMNRQEWIDKIRFGYASIGNDHPIGSVMPYHASDLEQRPYDPEKAKFHLKKAGMDNLKVDFHVSDAPFAGGVDAASLYQEAARPAGIDINIIRTPTDGYWSDVWNNKPFCLAQWGARPTPDMILSLVYAQWCCLE